MTHPGWMTEHERAVDAYVHDRITLAQLEEAVAHVLAGGRLTARCRVPVETRFLHLCSACNPGIWGNASFASAVPCDGCGRVGVSLTVVATDEPLDAADPTGLAERGHPRPLVAPDRDEYHLVDGAGRSIVVPDRRG